MNSSKLFYPGLGLAAFILAYLPMFILGEGAYVQIFDNLDSEFVYLKLLIQNNVALDYSKTSEIPQVMNGLPRNMFRSGHNFVVLCFYLLPPFYAYLVNKLIVHMVGFVGMYMLLPKFLSKNQPKVRFAIALAYGLVGYFHVQYGISIAGLPLLFYAFLNLLEKGNLTQSLAIIILFPFYAFTPVTIPFVVPALVIIGIVWYFQKDSVPLIYLYCTALFVAFSLLSEYPLLKSTLDPTIISHRTDWDREYWQFNRPGVKMLTYLLYSINLTPYLSGVIITLPIWLAVAFNLKRLTKREYLTGIILLLIYLWKSINPQLMNVLEEVISPLKTLSTDRFTFLGPMLWLLWMAMLMERFNWHKRCESFLARFLLASQILLIVWMDGETYRNLRLLTGFPIDEPTFEAYYSSDVFQQIRDHIPNDPSEYRVASLGLEANIAQFNGFYTLDGKQNNYLKSYKQEFRKIIEPELKKNKRQQVAFDFYGIRCYMTSSELSRHRYFKIETPQVTNLNLDIAQFRKMHGRYLLSTAQIKNSGELGLSFEGSFTSDRSPYDIKLYSVKDAKEYEENE